MSVPRVAPPTPANMRGFRVLRPLSHEGALDLIGRHQGAPLGISRRLGQRVVLDLRPPPEISILIEEAGERCIAVWFVSELMHSLVAQVIAAEEWEAA